MPAHVFVDELTRCTELQQLALCYVQVLITQMSQSIVCTGHHSVIERLSYWLLTNQDALLHDQLSVTHEMISNMLGVRRESVTQALGKLQAEGWVSSGRGKIAILNRDGLLSGVCECFSLVSSETRRLFEQALRQGEHPVLSAPVHGAVGDGVFGAGADSRLQKYQDAYDFAPVGFVSLNAQGQVIQTNLAGAILLGIQRSQRQSRALIDFIVPADQARFADFHQEVLSGKCRRHCELTLAGTDHRAEIVVRIEATLDDEGLECQLVLIDVTEDKRQAEQRLARERQQQEILATQPYMVWFKDAEGHLVSANANLIENWRHTEAAGQLERLDLRHMPWNVAMPAPQYSARPER
jgi:PAS domain S-box-containing protein